MKSAVLHEGKDQLLEAQQLGLVPVKEDEEEEEREALQLEALGGPETVHEQRQEKNAGQDPWGKHPMEEEGRTEAIPDFASHSSVLGPRA